MAETLDEKVEIHGSAAFLSDPSRTSSIRGVRDERVP